MPSDQDYFTLEFVKSFDEPTTQFKCHPLLGATSLSHVIPPTQSEVILIS